MYRSIEQITTAIASIDACLRHATDADAIDELEAEREELQAELQSAELQSAEEWHDDMMSFMDDWEDDWEDDLEDDWEETYPYDMDDWETNDWDDDDYFYDDQGFLH